MSNLKCGYLGPPGTFSQQAALSYFTGERGLNSFKSISAIFTALNEKEIDAGIVPVENSLEGAVNISMDLLFNSTDLTVIGEVVIPIEHYLIGNVGVKLNEINKLYSHSQAIAQCTNYITKSLPEAEVFNTESTALAARFIQGKRERAIIASKRVSVINKLEIIGASIQDNPENYTRFLVIAKEDLKTDYSNYLANKEYKTSIIYTPKVNRAGVLYEILGEFYQENINLTRIESRPTKRQLGEYLFYIDFEGHVDEGRISKALQGIERKSQEFKILGSYLKSKKFLGGNHK